MNAKAADVITSASLPLGKRLTSFRLWVLSARSSRLGIAPSEGVVLRTPSLHRAQHRAVWLLLVQNLGLKHHHAGFHCCNC